MLYTISKQDLMRQFNQFSFTILAGKVKGFVHFKQGQVYVGSS